MKRYVILGLGLLLAFCFVASGAVYAAEGKPCPKRKIHKKFWCEECKEFSEFPECSSQEYMWNTKEHKAKKANPHANLPQKWACATAGYYCIQCGKCFPRPGICDKCDDDTESRKSFAMIAFKCEKGHEHSEPGTGFKLREGAYEEEIEDAGNCPECGKPLEMICTKSGTCPHTT